MSTFLAIEANDDIPTRSAFAYRDLHLYQSLAPGLLLLLTRFRATRGDFALEASAPGAEYVVGVGHGDDDTLMGFGGEPILEPGLYQPAEVAGRIIHLLACGTANKLGADLVRSGARAFIGYNSLVIVHKEIIDDFLECDTAIDSALLAGDTVAEAHRKAITLFDQHIARLRAEGSLLKAALMETNRDSLMSPLTDRRLGDPNARLP